MKVAELLGYLHIVNVDRNGLVPDSLAFEGCNIGATDALSQNNVITGDRTVVDESVADHALEIGN